VEEGSPTMSKEPEDNAEGENGKKKEELPTVKVTRKGKLSLAWVIPLLAILLAGFLVYRSLPGKGVEIVIRTRDGAGIDANSTLISYRGVRIGIVNEVALDEDLIHVIIKARLERSASHVARAKTEFWIVRPEISFSGVKGLETIVSGPYITLRPGDGEPKFEFDALPSTPREERPIEGLKIQLTTKRIGGIKSGTPILYRDLIIGEIYDYRLAETAAFVRIFVNIEKPYRKLIRQNSVFWNSGGFDLKVSLLGAKITPESIRGILTGGISVATPDEPGHEAEDGKIFELQEEQKKEWLDWAPRIDIHSGKVEPKSKEQFRTKEGVTIKGLVK
jgi:paraquat-inducible protein B